MQGLLLRKEQSALNELVVARSAMAKVLAAKGVMVEEEHEDDSAGSAKNYGNFDDSKTDAGS